MPSCPRTTCCRTTCVHFVIHCRASNIHSCMYKASSAPTIRSRLTVRNGVVTSCPPPRVLAELIDAHRQIGQLQSEHSRLAAASEAVAADREHCAREISQLEGTIATLSTRNAQLASTMASAEATSRASRDEAAKAYAQADATRAEATALQDTVRGARVWVVVVGWSCACVRTWTMHLQRVLHVTSLVDLAQAHMHRSFHRHSHLLPLRTA